MKRVPANRYVVFFFIAGIALFWDIFTKDVVFADLGYPGGRPPFRQGDHQIFEHPENIEGESVLYLDGWLKFRHYTSFNYGALWGIGQGKSWLFATLSVVASLGVLYWLFVAGAAESKWLTVALAFILGGTLGNLYDRLALHEYQDAAGGLIHAVRDFLFFEFGNYPYPVFNFADVFLVTGAIMLVIQSFLIGDTETPTPETKPQGEEMNGDKR